MDKLSELERIKYELEREYENIDLLISNMQSIYDELFDKFKQELPKSWKISFIEEKDDRLSYFEIYDDVNGNIENCTIRHKGVIYNLTGNKNSKNKINKIIDNYFNKEERLDLIVEKCKNNYRLVSKEAFYELNDQDISLIYKGENNLYFYQTSEEYDDIYEISNIKFKEDFIELEFKTEIGKLCKELYLIKLLKIDDILE